MPLHLPTIQETDGYATFANAIGCTNCEGQRNSHALRALHRVVSNRVVKITIDNNEVRNRPVNGTPGEQSADYNYRRTARAVRWPCKNCGVFLE